MQGCPLQRVPTGPAPLPVCLADFGTSTFLLVSLRSEQSCAVPIWEKRDAAAAFASPASCVRGPSVSSPLPGPSGSAAARAAAPWAARSPYTASGHSRAASRAIRAGPADGAACSSGGGAVTICRASPGDAMDREGPARLPAHPRGETLAGSTGPGLLLQELRETAPGGGGVLEVRRGVSWGLFSGDGACQWSGTGNRVLGGLGFGMCCSGPAPGRFWGRGQWSPSRTTHRHVTPWVYGLGLWSWNLHGPHHIMSSPRFPTTALWGVDIFSVIF